MKIILSCLMATLMLCTGCVSTSTLHKSSPRKGGVSAKAVTPLKVQDDSSASTTAFEITDLVPREGVRILEFEGSKDGMPDDPRVNDLKKRYGAEEIVLKTTVMIFPNGDERWIQFATHVGAFQSRTLWTSVTGPMPALDLSSINPSSNEGKLLIARHNKRCRDIEQGRFVGMDYGVQTGEGYVPSLVNLLTTATIGYTGYRIGSGGGKTTIVNKPTITATSESH